MEQAEKLGEMIPPKRSMKTFGVGAGVYRRGDKAGSGARDSDAGKVLGPCCPGWG